MSADYMNGYKWGRRIRAVVILGGLVLLGWNAHRTFVYAAEIYRKSEVCDKIKCDKISDAGDTIEAMKLPLRKGP